MTIDKSKWLKDLFASFRKRAGTPPQLKYRLVSWSEYEVNEDIDSFHVRRACGAQTTGGTTTKTEDITK